MVGFSEVKRMKLGEVFHVRLIDFRVQKAYSGEEGLEVVIGDNTNIENSEKKFSIEIPKPVLSEVATQAVKELDLANSPGFRGLLSQLKLFKLMK